MMTSSNGNIFRVTGPLCGEFTGHRWTPCTKASDVELWCFLWTILINNFKITSDWMAASGQSVRSRVIKSLWGLNFHLLKNISFTVWVNYFCGISKHPLKFHTKYLTHTLKDAMLKNLRALRFKSSLYWLYCLLYTKQIIQTSDINTYKVKNTNVWNTYTYIST